MEKLCASYVKVSFEQSRNILKYYNYLVPYGGAVCSECSLTITKLLAAKEKHPAVNYESTNYGDDPKMTKENIAPQPISINSIDIDPHRKVLPYNQMLPNQIISNQVVPHQMISNQVVSNQLKPNQMVPSQITNNPTITISFANLKPVPKRQLQSSISDINTSSEMI